MWFDLEALSAVSLHKPTNHFFAIVLLGGRLKEDEGTFS